MNGSDLFVTDDGLPDDDGISINSSLESEHDSDQEWSVECIRDQAREDGKDIYLVEWADYSIEEATWEPEENLTDELLQDWRATQAKQARGEEKPFDTVAWQEAVDKRHGGKYQRHRNRNVERKRRGLQLKLWEGETKADYYLSDENVGQDDYNAIFPPPRPVERQERTADPKEIQSQKSQKQGSVETPAPRKRTTVTEKAIEKPKSPTEKKAPSSIPQSRPQPSSVASAANGYQGTVKKPVINKSLTNIKADLVAATAVPIRTIHRAKKTAVTSRTIVRSHNSGTGINVFAAGRQSKQRRQLVESVTDLSKDARMFATHRIKRKAELQSRDKADMAPGTLPSKLFSISRGPPNGSSPGTVSAVPRSALKRSADDLMARSASESSVTASEKTDSTLPPSSEQSPFTRPMSKKRKSVQFADLPLVDEPKSIDEMSILSISRPKRLKSPPMPSDPSQPSQPPPKPQSILRKLSITEYQSRSSGQSFEKTVVLGPSGTKDIQVTFENVRTNSDPWHLQFVNKDLLHFSRKLTARTFASQLGSVVERSLSHGSVRPKMSSDQEATDRAAERLRLGFFGVACFHEEFLVIIYPTNCEDWEKVVAEADATSPTNVTLRYAIFKPQPIATKPLPMRESNLPSPIEPRTAIFRDLLRFDYHRLLPPGVRDVRHNFYLAFPPSRKVLLDAVSEWLHVENPKCRVFSTKTTGDWTAFTDPKIVAQGVIIVHEAATDTLRRFPGLLKLLLHSKSAAYVFWSIGESLQQHPLYPSVRSVYHQAEPGTVELTRLFPHGNAILVTPSFLVSEPRRALQLFMWYEKTYLQPDNKQKIVAAANIIDYLRDLAFESSSYRDKLTTEGDNTSRWSKSEHEDIARKSGLSQEDCAARFETWAIVDGLRPSVQTSIVPDEEIQPIIFAAESIDANDEQSLVNWFGCWSQTRFDQFRKFHVLGTDRSAKISHSIKDCDIPLYPPGAGRDPGAKVIGNAHPLDPTSREPDNFRQPQSGETQMLGGLASHFFCGKLKELGKKYENPMGCAFGKVYGFPVSYFKDIANTADSYGDFHRNFATFDRWMEFPWPFFSCYQPGFQAPDESRATVFNTYFGFFYTPEEGSQSTPPARHPWIAIWRVQAPHRKWEGTELLIWDVAAKERFPTGNKFYESQLIPAQQHLIKMVRDKGADKHRGLALRQVWLGGFQSKPTECTSPIDVTFVNLIAMIQDTKGCLPALEHLLPGRGFHKVYFGTAPAPNESVVSNATTIDLMDRHRNYSGDSKIIFHPPRACRPIRPSRCENLFYKWVVNLNRRGQRKAYAYTFKPTVDWYWEQQVAENRHFEHINVSAWKRVFDIVRIPTVGEKGNKADTREAGRK